MWIETHIIKSDGSRGQTICEVGDDPLRDNAPRKQIEQEAIEYENWANEPVGQPHG